MRVIDNIFNRKLKKYISKNNDDNQEWLSKVLKDIPSGCTILDAGAGELRNKKFCNHLIYTSQDLCQYSGKGNRKGLQTGRWRTNKIDIVCDIINMPIKDGTFDVVLCSEVLEHLPDPVKAIREMSRILRGGGILILTAPFCSLTHFAPQHFCTGFNRYWYQKHLIENGLNIKQCRARGNYFDYILQELCRLPSVQKQYCIEINKINTFLKILILFIKPLLQKMSVLGASSNELLCFGYQVVAIKENGEN